MKTAERMPVRAGRGRRPHVALVAWRIAPRGFPGGELAAIVPPASEHVDFTVVSSELAEELRPIVRWRRAPAPRSWGRPAWAAFFLGASIRLRGVRADLVHVVGPAPLVAGSVDLASIVFCHAAYHAALSGRPGRGVPGLWRLARGFSVGLERACYRPGRARVLGAECPSGKRTLERHFPGVEVAVVPTPVDTSRFRPDAVVREEVRRTERVGAEENVAIFVGRDWELKGLSVAIRGVAEAARLGREVRLWVAGAGNVPKHERVAEEAGVGDRVRFLGYRDDLERFYQAADALVLPTLCEMFCRAAYEAAACGLPVVATEVPGVSELVGGSEAGLLVERDPASVGGALALLASDPDLRRRLGEEGRSRTVGFTVERSVEALLGTYERLLGAVPAAAPRAASSEGVW